MLTPLFGAGAFDTGGHRFGRFVAAAARGDSAVAAAFTDAWRECQDRVGVGADLTGPSSPGRSCTTWPTRGVTARGICSGASRGRSRRCRRECSAWRSRRRPSWWSATRGVRRRAARATGCARGRRRTSARTWRRAPLHTFREVATAYFGLASPVVAPLGLARPAADMRQPARARVSDPHGVQLALATLPGDDHAIRSAETDRGPAPRRPSGG
jgi:hypothetical protein